MKAKLKYLEIILPKTASFLSTPEMVSKVITAEDFDIATESLYLLALDSKNCLIKKIEVAKGSDNTVCAKGSDIFRRLLILGCSNMILVHNHPSGDVAPSAEDLNFTKRITKGAELIGVKLLDHLIFDQEGKSFYSFRENGIL